MIRRRRSSGRRAARLDLDRDDALRGAQLDVVQHRARGRVRQQRRERVQEDGEQGQERGAAAHRRLIAHVPAMQRPARGG